MLRLALVIAAAFFSAPLLAHAGDRQVPSDYVGKVAFDQVAQLSLTHAGKSTPAAACGATLALSSSATTTGGVDPTGSIAFSTNDVVVALYVTNAGGVNATLSNTAHLTWTLAPGSHSTPVTNHTTIWYAIASGSATESPAAASGTGGALTLFAVSGANTGGGSSTMETTVESGTLPVSIVTTFANTFVFAFTFSFSSTDSAPWAILGSATAFIGSEYQIAASATTYTATMSGGVNGAIGAIKRSC